LKRRAHLAGWASLLVALGAEAQDSDAVAQNVSPATSDSAAQSNSVVGEDSAADVNLGPAELRARGLEAVTSIEASSKAVRAMATAAKDKRDVVKVLCLEDKTTQVKAALGTAEERVEALKVAVDSAALERAKHEYVMLMTLKDRVTTLMNEANQCIGEETGFSGDAELSVEIDPNLPQVQADVVGFVAVVAIPPSLSSAVY
jgi:hypothetical protein